MKDICFPTVKALPVHDYGADYKRNLQTFKKKNSEFFPTLTNDFVKIEIQTFITDASYLHKTVSGVGVEVERGVIFHSFREGGMRRHHSSLNISPWWSAVNVHINFGFTHHYQSAFYQPVPSIHA